MSDSRSFLARWSERKRAEARAERAPEPPKAPESESPPDAEAPKDQATPEEPTAALDLDCLPSLEDITGDTDIGGFLRRGVPGDLRNAALRRAWTSDPTISRFIEMADYDWDFNAPGGNQVFGPLSSAVDAARMAAEILSPPPRAEPEPVERDTTTEGSVASRVDVDDANPEPAPTDLPSFEDDVGLTPEEKAPVELPVVLSDPALPMSIGQESSEILVSKVALRNPPAPELASSGAPRRRRHGGALPDSK